MPRGNPKRKVMLRLDPGMVERVKLANGGNFTQAVEAALEAWLKRASRKPRTDRLAQHLAPPTEQEIPAPTKGDAA
jgi:hypothetical protein